MKDKQYFELQQGDILFLDFDPTFGHEQRGYRPCIVLTKSIKYLNYMIGVAPITSNSKEFSLPTSMQEQGKILLEHHRLLDLESYKFRFVEAAPSEFTEECLGTLKLLY